MKKKTIIVVSILVAAIAATWYFKSGKKEPPVTLVTAKPQYGYIAKSITATGTVQPVDTVSVGAQVSGVVKDVYVDFNAIVKHGQLLAKVDPSIIIAQTEQSKANLANARSNLEYQENNFHRQSELFNLGAISKADYQVAVNLYRSANAVVANAAAQLRLAERNLFYTNIYSPINGVVLNRSVSAGQTIASSFNAPTLFVIAKDLTKMQVRAAVDEADIGAVRAGEHVTFTVDAFPDDIFKGIVQQILLHPAVSANVVTYPTLINVDNKEMKLKPGMTASINIYTREEDNALLIPSKALSFKPDSSLFKFFTIRKASTSMGPFGKAQKGKTISRSALADNKTDVNSEQHQSNVWIKKADTLIEKRVVTGMNDDSYVMVIKGLTPNEEVVSGVSGNGSKNNGANTQRSPFMPQMPRRPAASRSL